MTPLRIHKCLAHDRVGTHETRWKAAGAFASALGTDGGNSGRAGCWRREHLAEVEAARSDQLRDFSTKIAAERSLAALGKQPHVGAATKDAVGRHHARDGETLRAQRLERCIGNRQRDGGDFGRDVLIPVRARRGDRGGGLSTAIEKQRRLDEGGEDGLSREVKGSVARRHHCVESDRLDHSVTNEDRGLINGVARRDDDLRADERVTRGLARPHAVDRCLLRWRIYGDCADTGDGGKHRSVVRMHRRIVRDCCAIDEKAKSPAKACACAGLMILSLNSGEVSSTDIVDHATNRHRELVVGVERAVGNRCLRLRHLCFTDGGETIHLAEPTRNFGDFDPIGGHYPR